MVVGARYWNGEYTDVPAMGMNSYMESDGYCQVGDKILFKVWDASSNKLTDMTANSETPWYDMSVSVINLTNVLPDNFSLDRAYPNPFNPTTTLSFAMPVDSEVLLSIYNLQGRQLSTLISGNITAGYHSIVWDASSYASGVYFVKLISGNNSVNQKVVLIK